MVCGRKKSDTKQKKRIEAPRVRKHAVARVSNHIIDEMTESELLKASDLITVYSRGGKVDMSKCSKRVGTYVASVTKVKSPQIVQGQLQLLNKRIIESNRKANVPTAKTKELYKRMMED